MDCLKFQYLLLILRHFVISEEEGEETKISPGSYEYFPVKYQDEYQRHKECGAGGKNLIRNFLAHLQW